jgi:hypothetical protein
MNQTRYKRLRLLVSEFNKERRRQAQKIDILCNDFVSAQREFIKRLTTIGFAASFYESIIGINEQAVLLENAAQLIKDEIGEANIVFFLRGSRGFESHIFDSEAMTLNDCDRLENCLSPEIAENICKANRLCIGDDFMMMGLLDDSSISNRYCAATIPLGCLGVSTGFILIYRPIKQTLSDEELNSVSAVAIGLSRAIQASRVTSQSAN